MFDGTLDPNEQRKNMAHLLAQYFDKLESWLAGFNLMTPGGWESLYATLADKLIVPTMPDKLGAIASPDSGRQPSIAIDQVFMPSTAGDIFKLCRILFQALVPLQIAVPDGQHRIAAMMELLAGWTITIKPLGIPPKGFEPSDHHGLVSKGKEDTDIEEDFKQLLKVMSGKVTARVMVPTALDSFEQQCIEYSRFRDESQFQHKPRVLVDM